ncbi:MAG: GDP-mannose 4,6-dehydratase, partial [Chromatiales bacterium]|nr:GDP-mannose 4,6-dehydratase [Chromatiales bacterium]
GEGLDEQGIDRDSGKVIVAVDPRYFRPTEVETLLGDASKAREKLGWAPKITFEEMVREMMQADLELAKRDDLVEREGYKAFKYYE